MARNSPLLGLSREEPIHKACRQNSIDIVRYFIGNGGDINQPDKMNTTCLMQSLSNTELCRLLIERGADVNAVDRFGYTVLHIAVLSGHLPIVRLLIENGGDPSICDSNGDDVLQFAALIACKPDAVDAVVLEYLIEKVKPSAQRRADLYALVAAALVLDKEDEDHALPYWIKSFNVQMAEQTEDSVKVGTEAPNLACITPVEGRDVASLAGNTDAMLTQSLAVRERILGPDHYDTLSALYSWQSASSSSVLITMKLSVLCTVVHGNTKICTHISAV